mmetsp:Transcript_9754/g.11657  ORF Transcript_9754/g.11657 Transcript_9754/m.11657 type:complete len:169 (-) Transcript_9754:37-543(-)
MRARMESVPRRCGLVGGSTALALFLVCFVSPSPSPSARWRRAEGKLRINLLAHNMMQGFEAGSYPLKLEATKTAMEPTEFDAENLVKLLHRVDYSALRTAAKEIGAEGLPDELPFRFDLRKDAPLLKQLHTILLEVHVVAGHLVCPKTGRKFVIYNGIPNMLMDSPST